MDCYFEEAFDRIFRKFDEFEARWDRHFSAAPEQCAPSPMDAEVVADNWGGLFGPAPVPEEDVFVPATTDSASPPWMKEPRGAAVVADNWGGLFEQPSPTSDECSPLNFSAAASTDSVAPAFASDAAIDSEFACTFAGSAVLSLDATAIRHTSTAVPDKIKPEEESLPEESPFQIQEREEVVEADEKLLPSTGSEELEFAVPALVCDSLAPRAGDFLVVDLPALLRPRPHQQQRTPLLPCRLRRPWRAALRRRPWRARPRPPWSHRPWDTPPRRRRRRFHLRRPKLRPRRAPQRRRGRPPRLLIRVRGRRSRLRARARAAQRRAALRHARVAELSATARAEEQRHHIHSYKATACKRKSDLWNWVVDAERTAQADRAAFAKLGSIDLSLRLRSDAADNPRRHAAALAKAAPALFTAVAPSPRLPMRLHYGPLLHEVSGAAPADARELTGFLHGGALLRSEHGVPAATFLPKHSGKNCSTARLRSRPEPPDAAVRRAVRVCDYVLLIAPEAPVELATMEHFAQADLDVKLMGSARYCTTSVIECKARQDAHLVFDKMLRRYNNVFYPPHSSGVVLFGHIFVIQEARGVFEGMARHLSEILWPPPMHISNKLCTVSLPSVKFWVDKSIQSCFSLPTCCCWDAVLYWELRQWLPPTELRLVNCEAVLCSLLWPFSAPLVAKVTWSPFTLFEIKGDAVHLCPLPWLFVCCSTAPAQSSKKHVPQLPWMSFDPYPLCKSECFCSLVLLLNSGSMKRKCFMSGLLSMIQKSSVGSRKGSTYMSRRLMLFFQYISAWCWLPTTHRDELLVNLAWQDAGVFKLSAFPIHSAVHSGLYNAISVLQTSTKSGKYTNQVAGNGRVGSVHIADLFVDEEGFLVTLCLDLVAVQNRLPWPSFNMVEICSVRCYRVHRWKFPWPIHICHQIRSVLTDLAVFWKYMMILVLGAMAMCVGVDLRPIPRPSFIFHGFVVRWCCVFDCGKCLQLGGILVRKFSDAQKPSTSVCHGQLILAAARAMGNSACKTFLVVSPFWVAADAQWEEPDIMTKCTIAVTLITVVTSDSHPEFISIFVVTFGDSLAGSNMKMLFLCWDYKEDYEVMIPFLSQPALGCPVNAYSDQTYTEKPSHDFTLITSFEGCVLVLPSGLHLLLSVSRDGCVMIQEQVQRKCGGNCRCFLLDLTEHKF